MTYRRAAVPLLALLLLPRSVLAQGTSPAQGDSNLVRLMSRPDFALWLAAVVLLSVTLILLVLFVGAARWESPRIESHWGGFGGGLGGWRISASLAYLVAAMVFGALFMTVARDLANYQPPRAQTTTPPPDPGAAPAKGGPAPTPAAAPSDGAPAASSAGATASGTPASR